MMTIEPCGSWYHVVPIDPQGKTAGKLILASTPDKDKKALSVGVVLAAGPGEPHPHDSTLVMPMYACEGQVIHYLQSIACGMVSEDGKPIVFVRNSDIICVLKGITPETIKAAPGNRLAIPTPSDTLKINGAFKHE